MNKQQNKRKKMKQNNPQIQANKTAPNPGKNRKNSDVFPKSLTRIIPSREQVGV